MRLLRPPLQMADRKESERKVNAIHHIAIIASDYQVSRDFYVNKLDLQLGNCGLELFE